MIRAAAARTTQVAGRFDAPGSSARGVHPAVRRVDLAAAGRYPTQPPHTGNTWPTKQAAASLAR